MNAELPFQGGTGNVWIRCHLATERGLLVELSVMISCVCLIKTRTYTTMGSGCLVDVSLAVTPVVARLV
jgi:hypothetical protein